ncbi:MAG: hypothetical protein M0Q90_14215 [Bacteroidales bacterium]|nr:hypothetical protein [Bacteroidales bacterium]
MNTMITLPIWMLIACLALVLMIYFYIAGLYRIYKKLFEDQLEQAKRISKTARQEAEANLCHVFREVQQTAALPYQDTDDKQAAENL